MILVKLLPFVPGHFTRREAVARGLWALVGAAAWHRCQMESSAPEAAGIAFEG